MNEYAFRSIWLSVNHNSLKLKLILVGFVLLGIIVGFNTVFNLSSFYGFYTESINDDFSKSFNTSILVKYIGAVIVVFICCIMILFTHINNATKNVTHISQFNKKLFSVVLFIIICLSQIFSSGIAALIFKNNYLSFNENKIEIFIGSIQSDINNLFDNPSITSFDSEALLNSKFFHLIPELKYIEIQNNYGEKLYADKKDINFTSDADNSYHTYRMEIEENKKTLGYISIKVSNKKLNEKLVDIGIDLITMIVITIFFSVELLILTFAYLEQVSSQSKLNIINYKFMRPAIFLFLFGLDLSLAFLPLHMENLYKPIFGLSKDVIIGLPISVEFFFVGIAIFISGIWLDKRGWHEPFLIGLTLACAGIFYSWLAPDALHFIISRGIAGFGFGLSLMASQGFVITYSDDNCKTQALAHLIAGIYAGSICGGAAGAILAEHIGYNFVFLSGAIIMCTVIIYTIIFMRTAFNNPESNSELRQQVNPAYSISIWRQFLYFISNKNVLSLIFLSSLPASIAVVGFINYFSPIYLNRIGVSESSIGRILMIYGICLIYVGPLISKYIDASNNKKLFIFLGCMLGSLAFLSFTMFEGIVVISVAVFLLGLSHSFILPSQTSYALKLEVTKNLGEGKAIGIFRSSSRLGQMLGPVIFSWVIAASNINDSITYLGIIYMIMAFLFLAITQKDRVLN